MTTYWKASCRGNALFQLVRADGKINAPKGAFFIHLSAEHMESHFASNLTGNRVGRGRGIYHSLQVNGVDHTRHNSTQKIDPRSILVGLSSNSAVISGV